MNTVAGILRWAGEHNDEAEENKHFPVVGVSYGYLAMLMSQDLNESYFKTLRDD